MKNQTGFTRFRSADLSKTGRSKEHQCKRDCTNQLRIPTGFRPPAQGCEEGATLGKFDEIHYPEGVALLALRLRFGLFRLLLSALRLQPLRRCRRQPRIHR